MNDMQRDLLGAVEAAIIKVIPNGRLRRQAGGEPGVLRLYVEPKNGKTFDCVTAFRIIFGEEALTVGYWDRTDWKTCGSAPYTEGDSIRRLIEGVRQRAAADVACVSVAGGDVK